MEKTSYQLKGTSRTVDLYVGSGIIKRLSSLLDLHGLRRRIVLTNDRVWDLWGEKIRPVLGSPDNLIVIPDGERFKSISTAERIFGKLAGEKATRTTTLVAVGGGVIGDLGGFVASTFHRGMHLVHVPTTVLAQVDSSIGGKTGVNLPAGKNLVGSFYHPLFILTDTAVLGTLPESEFSGGLAEIIKAALIRDVSLFTRIESRRDAIRARRPAILSEIIHRAQLIKIDVVRRDERESGLRAILNYGHTIGHALEKLSRWKIPHGNAVSAGMGYASFVSCVAGRISFDDFIRIINILRYFRLPLFFDVPEKTIAETLQLDKKRKEQHVEWVLLKSMGKASYGERIPADTLLMLLRDYRRFVGMLPATDT